MRVLLLLFQFGFLSFLFLLGLLWLKLPKLCWIVVVRVGCLSCSWLYGKCFQFFTIEDNVCCGFILYGFYYFEVCSFYAWFLEGFIINECWILSKAFSASIEIIIWFLSFNLLMWCITLIDLWILKNPCIPEIKPTWSWCMIILIGCWILFARILLRIFASMFFSGVGLKLSFFVASLVLVLGWWWPHRMHLRIYLPLQFSGRVWVG